MSNQFIFPEWLVSNAIRAFPLSESASRRDLRGVVTFPDSLVVAAAINALPEYATGAFYLSSLLCFPDYVAVDLSFQPAQGDSRVVCRLRADASTHVENSAYPILGSGEDASVTGSLTFGDLRQAQSETLGVYSFSADATPFEVACLFVTVPALKYVQVFDGNTLLGTFNSVLRLRSGQNVRLRYVDQNTIAIDAIAGLNLVAPDSCEQLVVLGPPIKTINGVAPNADGDFTLDGSDCIAIDPLANGLQVEDTCSASCCGCTELNALTQGAAQLAAQVAFLQQQVQAVQSNQTEMIINLVSGLH
jgi:hypothetical protein